MSTKRKNIVLIAMAIVAIICATAYFYLHQDHRDIQGEEAEFVLTTSKFHAEFMAGAAVSGNKYLNKTIAVSGNISEINDTEITLEDKVFCQFSTPMNKKRALHSKIEIKGRFIGYDDLLEQIKLDQCTIIN